MEYADEVLEFLTEFVAFPIIAIIVIIISFIVAYPKMKAGFEGIHKLLSKLTSKLKFNNMSSWEEYVCLLKNSYSKTRSIINPQEEIKFYDLYVSPLFSFEGRGINSTGSKATTQHIADELHKERSKILLVSAAGSGKSMAAQDVFLKILEEEKKIPVFLPLHYINGLPHKNYSLISKFIYSRFFASIPNFSLSMFYEMEKKGRFIYILDGYDELDFRITPHFLQILDPWFLNQKCGILLTTRPGTGLHALAETKSFEMSPFKDREVKLLINNFKKIAPKNAALLEERLNNNLIDEPEEFLSNPLLATVLLLGATENTQTFKIVDVFRSAFFALYKRHDRYKREEVIRMHSVQKVSQKIDLEKGYERKTNNLDVNEFEEIISNYAWQIWRRGKRSGSQEFTEKTLKSITSSMPNKINADELLSDLQISLPILIDRRHGVEFIHKSFLEYFAAMYIIKYWDKDGNKSLLTILRKYEARLSSEQVLQFMQQISPERFDKMYMAPRIRLLIRRMKGGGVHKSSKPAPAVLIFFDMLKVFKLGKRHAYKLSAYGESLKFICENYETELFEKPVTFETWISKSIIPTIFTILDASEHSIKIKPADVDLDASSDTKYFLPYQINSLTLEIDNALEVEYGISDYLKNMLLTIAN